MKNEKTIAAEELTITEFDHNTLTVMNQNGDWIEVPALPVCDFCCELAEDCIGYDDRTKSCQTCRESGRLGDSAQVNEAIEAGVL